MDKKVLENWSLGDKPAILGEVVVTAGKNDRKLVSSLPTLERNKLECLSFNNFFK
jgi:hypothetical protein